MPSAEKEETTNDVAMKKYRALYDYDASKDDELSFKAGTIIEVIFKNNVMKVKLVYLESDMY